MLFGQIQESALIWVNVHRTNVVIINVAEKMSERHILRVNCFLIFCLRRRHAPRLRRVPDKVFPIHHQPFPASLTPLKIVDTGWKYIGG
jgi:hypothetical protein